IGRNPAAPGSARRLEGWSGAKKQALIRSDFDVAAAGTGRVAEISTGETDGEEKRQDARPEGGQDCGAERPQAALATVVRQSGKPGHDRALSGALSQLRPHACGADLG